MDLLTEFEEKKVKQIHFIVKYLPLNIIHPKPNLEPDHEPNHELNNHPNPQPNNSPNIEPNNPQLNNQPTSSFDSDPLYKGLVTDSVSSSDTQIDSDEEGGSDAVAVAVPPPRSSLFLAQW
ncbi:hypothetical protein ACOSQ4_014591 [Xanthoceras sorbifolium]